MQLPRSEKPGKTWIEISEKSLISNLNFFRKIVGRKTKILCVVKANAYGHGLRETVTALTKNKIDFFGVDNLTEALTIREMGIETPVLILGYTPLSNLRDAIENDISLTIYDIDHLRQILSFSSHKVAKIHLKVETGLNRQGIPQKDIYRLAKFINKNSAKLFLEGIPTHYANIDEVYSRYANYQLERFKEVVEFLERVKLQPKIIHSAATAATLLNSKTHFDMIRLGIGLYGLWPSKEAKLFYFLKHAPNREKLEPVLSWKSLVAQIKTINIGESVGYARTWFAERKTKVSVIPIGYSDGFDRSLSNIGHVLINGEFAPVIGRVSMNMITVDATEISEVNIEDEVVIIGKSGKNEILADDIANKIGTINYEVISKLNPGIPRLVI